MSSDTPWLPMVARYSVRSLTDYSTPLKTGDGEKGGGPMAAVDQVDVDGGAG